MSADATRAVVAHYDERAATYDESAMHRDLAAFVGERVDLDDVDAVLDVATGTGLMLRSLARRRAVLRLVGVDLSPAMLAVARRALPEAALLRSDAATLPVPDGRSTSSPASPRFTCSAIPAACSASGRECCGPAAAS